MMFYGKGLRAILLILLPGSPLLSASFEAAAVESCPAYNDLRHQRNSGDLHLEKGKKYRVIREHKGHYLLRLPVTPATQRWVEKRCLRKPDRTRHDGSSPNAAEESGPDTLLVLSWHNSFCETRPNARECRPLGNHAANRLVLHGLWPQPPSRIYCNVPESLKQKDRNRQWRALPRPELPDPLRKKLLRYMPGSLSALDRHEWIKHGRCYDPDPVRYFGDALTLTETVDRSIVGEYLRANVGARISLLSLIHI